MAWPLLPRQVEDLEVRRATASDLSAVSAVLTEAAIWLEEKGIPLWDADSLSDSRIKTQVLNGEFWLFFRESELAGVVKFQLEDLIYWPDSIAGEAAYVHKLVVRRAYAGEGVSTRILEWAAKRAGELKRSHLRLDCEVSRDRLRRIYEDFGFARVGDIDLDGRIMARFQLDISK